MGRTTLLYRTPGADTQGLDTPARRVLDLTDENSGISVYECAAHLGLPYPVVRLITAYLIERGTLTATAPPAPAALPDAQLLEVVLNGLRAL
ncbi:DUF742 domain-containing protein [Streptomyces hebeiensis]|uniref:DUF742 domain-containing protein n=1 Tax=Streptomyces hebeiensis TaxID=229486 RepID=UPI0031DC41EE